MRTRSYQRYDYVIFFSTLILVIAGFVVLVSASSTQGIEKFGDSLFYLKHQLVSGFVPGVALLLFFALFYYKKWQKISLVFLGASIALLVLVKFTALGSQSGSGATRWLGIGDFTFQPAEFVKLFYVIFVAAWLTKKPSPYLFMAVNVIVIGLIAFQPSLSNAAILGVSVMIMYIVSGARWRDIGLCVLIGAVLFSGFIVYKGGYHLDRITTFVSILLGNAGQYDDTSGYQQRWSTNAIGSGGFIGVGYGNSLIKEGKLPEPFGDSIFAVFAQEFGFLGAMLLIILFLAIVIWGILLARRIHDQFGKSLVIGIISLIGIQAFVNMAALSGVIPITGVPLPFISYGGSALIMFLAGTGLVLNVSKYGK